LQNCVRAGRAQPEAQNKSSEECLKRG
jgi:hypothetical protein